MKIQITTLASPALNYHIRQDVPEGVDVDLLASGIERRDLGAVEVAGGFLLTIAGGVTTKLLAAWLYDKLKAGGSTRIEIDRERIEISEQSITRTIERIRIKK